MNKIILISINGIGDIETMKSINVDEKTMKEIFKTYDRLNISRKKIKIIWIILLYLNMIIVKDQHLI